MTTMFNIFKQEKVLALDIRGGILTGLLGEPGPEGLRIVTAFSRQIDGDPATALARALEDEEIPPCLVYMSLSSEHCFLRFAEVPPAGEKEIRRILSVRMDAEMPVPLSELYWDCWLISGQEKREAVMVACERSRAHKYYDLLVKKGFKPQLVTFDVLVLRDLILRKLPIRHESFMVLSQQGKRLFFLIFEAGSLKYFRTANLANKDSDVRGIILKHFSRTIQYWRDYRKLAIPKKAYFLNDELREEIRSKVVKIYKVL